MKPVFFAVALLFVVEAPCRAEVLGTGTITAGVGFPQNYEHRFRPVLDFAGHALFEDVYLDSTSLGVILTADAASDSDFVAVSQLLSNGVDDKFCILLMFPPGGGGPCPREKAFFGLAGADFSGHHVEALSLRVDALSWTQPNPIGGTSVLATFTIEVHGTRGVTPATATTWGRLKTRYR